MLRAYRLPGRPHVITTAPGRLVRALVRLSAWLDAHGPSEGRGDDLAPVLQLPPERLNRTTLRPCPGMVRRVR